SNMHDEPSFCLLPVDVPNEQHGTTIVGQVKHGKVGHANEATDVGVNVEKMPHVEVVTTCKGFVVTKGLLDVDASLEDAILSPTENKTKQKDNWARKKFDNWRKLSGLDCEVGLEKLEL
ncbi:hypothetical protein GOP47_0005999, partial [Adiantum capillus-veneris]